MRVRTWLFFLVLLAGFFALAGLLVRGCERIIGPDQLTGADSVAQPEPDAEAVAA